MMRVCVIAVFLSLPALCSARLSRGDAPKVVADENHFLDQTLGKDLKHLASVLANSTLRKPEPQKMYTDHAGFTCRKLFAYKDTREACYRLQPVICVKGCKALLPKDGNVAQCHNIQNTICELPKRGKAPKPIKLPGDPEAYHVTTFCNAYPTQASVHIQHDKYHALQDPKPFLPDLKYLDCKQVMIPAGEAVNVFLGNYPAATHVVGGENSIVMLGQYKLGELQMGVTIYAFKDEGYKRPIVCNAYPEPELATSIAGRDWHPYVHAQHPKHLKYMECEKLNLDHVDSHHDPESIEFSLDGKVKGHALVSPVHSLYLVGSKGDSGKTITFKQYNYEHGTLRESK